MKKSGCFAGSLFTRLFPFVCISLALSCASVSTSAKKEPDPARTFGPKGIEIKIAASGLLNAHNDEPHALVMLVYQLDNINSFKQLTKDESGIEKLLQKEKFDPSVLSIDQLVIEPGDNKTFLLDRAENTKWVGIVAGYYSLSPGLVSRFYEIPVKVEKTGVYGFRKTEAKLGHLSVNLNLGPGSLNEMEAKK